MVKAKDLSGDEDAWIWKEIKAAVNGGSEIAAGDEDARDTAQGVSNPSTFYDLASALAKVKATLVYCRDVISFSADDIAGEESQWFKGEAAAYFHAHMMAVVDSFDSYIVGLEEDLDARPVRHDVIAELTHAGNELGRARSWLQEIDHHYASEAKRLGAEVMDNGLIRVSDRPDVVELLNQDMRRVFKGLKETYGLAVNSIDSSEIAPMPPLPPPEKAPIRDPGVSVDTEPVDLGIGGDSVRPHAAPWGGSGSGGEPVEFPGGLGSGGEPVEFPGGLGPGGESVELPHGSEGEGFSDSKFSPSDGLGGSDFGIAPGTNLAGADTLSQPSPFLGSQTGPGALGPNNGTQNLTTPTASFAPHSGGVGGGGPMPFVPGAPGGSPRSGGGSRSSGSVGRSSPASFVPGRGSGGGDSLRRTGDTGGQRSYSAGPGSASRAEGPSKLRKAAGNGGVPLVGSGAPPAAGKDAKRERKTWLLEEDDVWGAHPESPAGPIGRKDR